MKYRLCCEQLGGDFLARVIIEKCYSAPVDDEEAESNMIEHKNQHKYPFL